MCICVCVCVCVFICLLIGTLFLCRVCCRSVPCVEIKTPESDVTSVVHLNTCVKSAIVLYINTSHCMIERYGLMGIFKAVPPTAVSGSSFNSEQLLLVTCMRRGGTYNVCVCSGQGDVGATVYLLYSFPSPLSLSLSLSLSLFHPLSPSQDTYMHVHTPMYVHVHYTL